MTRHPAFAFFCALSAGLLPAADAAPAQTLVPADSFIVTHVGTVAQLHRQIALDPVVRRRLARHFHTSAPAVTRYIQENLVLTTLKKPGRYGVYCVSRSGQEYKITEHLAAGTPVFVLRSTGQPVLKLACGNPMMAALPPVKTKVAASYSLAPSHSLAASPAKPLRTAPVPTPPLSSSGPVVVAMAGTPAVVIMPTTKVAGFIGQLPAVHGGGGFPLGYLAGLPILALIGGHSGGSNHSPNTGTTGTGTTGTAGTGTTGTETLGTTGTGTSGNNTSGTTGGTDTLGTSTGNTGVAPVPEPAPSAAFAVGGAALLYLLGSATRRSRKAR